MLAAINGFADRIAGALAAQDATHALLNLGGVSAVDWFAFFAIGSIAWENGPAEPLRRADIVVAAGMLVAALVPLTTTAAIAVLVGGGYAAASAAPGSRTRRMAFILLALTGPLVWGPLLLTLFAPLVLGTDARFAGWLAHVPTAGNMIHFASTSDAMVVAPGCSSVHNMSLAFVLWATLVQLLRIRATIRVTLVALAGAVVMAIVNVTRLAVMAHAQAHFDLLHKGVGSMAFSMLSLIAAFLVISVGLVLATRARD